MATREIGEKARNFMAKISFSDYVSVAAILVALVSAYHSYSVAEDARLDAKRQSTRADAIAIFDALQNKLEFVQCHAIALGEPVDIHDVQLKNVIEQMRQSRNNLALIDLWEDAGLDEYRKHLNETPSQWTAVADELARTARAGLSADALERVDRVCRIDG